MTLPVPDEPRDEGGVGKPEHLLRAPLLHDAPVGHHRDHVAQAQRVIEVVGHLQRRDALGLVQRAKFPPQHRAGGRVHRGERLVQQQHRWPWRERSRDRHPLLLATAQAVHAAPEQRRDAEQPGERLHPRLGGLARPRPGRAGRRRCSRRPTGAETGGTAGRRCRAAAAPAAAR